MGDTFTYDEFEFFNKRINIVPKEEFKKFKKEKNNFYINDKLKEKKMFLFFDKNKIEVIKYKQNIDMTQEKLNRIVYHEMNRGLFFNFKPILTSGDLSVLQGHYGNNDNIFIDTPNELKDMICDKLNSYDRDKPNSLDKKLFDKYIELFGLEVYKDFSLAESDAYNNCEYHIIVGVYEHRKDNMNYRLVFYKDMFEEEDYIMRMYSEEHVDYTKLDIGRIVFYFGRYHCDDLIFMDLNCIETNIDGKIIINNKLCRYIYNRKSKLISDNLMTSEIYNFYKSRINSLTNLKSSGNVIEDKIVIKYLELLRNSKEIKINNFLIHKNYIKLVDENFTIEFDDKFLNIERNFNDLYKLLKNKETKYNFNILYEKIIEISKMGEVYPHSGTNFKSSSVIVNGLPVTLEKNGNRYYINNIFIRIYDVKHLLNNILCYDNITEYNKYLKGVSYIGIKFIKLINTGINIQLTGNYEMFGMNTPIMRLSLFWDITERSKLYLMMNGTKHFICNKSKFLKYFNELKSKYSISQLKDIFGFVIKDFNPSNFQNLLEDILEEGRIVQERGLALIKDTIRDINAKKCVVNINNLELTGYLLIGNQTKKEYFIKADDLSVYMKKDGTWNKRCVVDKAGKHRIYEDRLANRLVNIYNEPEYIYTIG